MSWTPEQEHAHAQLQTAIDNVLEAFGRFDDGTFQIGWGLIVGGAALLKGSEIYEDDDDDDGMVSSYAYFCKRGQLPALSRGLIEHYRDQYTLGH